ncbi:MAG: translocation/assembly module TamB domain-containing protein [Campylobacterales bacterium]|nr:translocation/assembly module TamB domain-containing protein [Campylobacterales bacterium]
MIWRWLYLLLFYLVVLLLLLMLFVVVAVHHPKTLPMLSQAIETQTPVRFSKLEGTLSNNLIFHDISYETLFSAKRIELHYNLLELLAGSLHVEQLELEGALLDLHHRNRSNPSEAPIEMPLLPYLSLERVSAADFTIRTNVDITLALEAHNLYYDARALHVQQARVAPLEVHTHPSVLVELNATDLRFDGALHVAHAEANASFEGYRAWAQGSMSDDTFSGSGRVAYPQELLAPVQGHLSPLPNPLEIKAVEAGYASVRLNTSLRDVMQLDTNITLEAPECEMAYDYNRSDIALHVRHNARHTEFNATLEHNISIDFKGNVTDRAALHLDGSSHPLWFDEAQAKVILSDDFFALDLTLPQTKLQLRSNDYRTFDLQSQVRELRLDFLQMLPDYLRRDPLSLELEAQITPNLINGALDAHTLHTRYNARFNVGKAHQNIDGNLTTDGESEFWQALGVRDIAHLHTTFVRDEERVILYAGNEELHATLFEREGTIKGWGSVATTTFDARGTRDDSGVRLELSSHIGSLYTLIDSVKELHYPEGFFFDTGMEIEGVLLFGEDIYVGAEVKLPWYYLQNDPQNGYFGTDGRLHVSIDERSLRIDDYKIEALGHTFFSNRPSILRRDDNGTLLIDRFWIDDMLKAVGYYSIQSGVFEARIHGKHAHYEGREGKLSADIDITIVHDENQTLIEGEAAIRSALITYKPTGANYVEDDDIVVIQEVKPVNDSKLALNVRLHNLQTLRYKTDMADLDLNLDLTLWKEPRRPLELLGLLRLDKGLVYTPTAELSMRKSELYFAGGEKINPYLNLHLYYAIDNKEIDIYATHTLSSPVLLFTSNPAMSQSDILSYILFGAPASSSFESEEGASSQISTANLLLGTGFKELIGDTTGLRIDRLNLLSTKEGNVGFEIGTRLNKDTRVVFKSDDIFSMVLQWQLSSNLQVHVDVMETGQGINLIYVREFADPWAQLKEQ